MKKHSALPVVAILALGASASTQADMFRPSKPQQVQLGQRAAGELRHSQKVLPSTDPRVRLVRRIGNKLLSMVDTRSDPWQFSFDVIESKDVNAFALPGGPTFIYTGLLDKLKTEDELAGVMGHELTHVLREHWASAYADSQKRDLGISLLLIFSHASRTVANIAGISNQLVFDLPFSRKHESEADEGGLKMMTECGYNPEGMVDVFAMLSKQASGGKTPEFLSDHPNDSNRIKRIQQLIDRMPDRPPQQRPLRLDNTSYWNGYSRFSNLRYDTY